MKLYYYASVLFLALIMLFILSGQSSAVEYKKYYEGIPDYEKVSPFVKNTEALHKELREILLKTTVDTKDCNKGTINVPGLTLYILKSNICESSDFLKIKSIIKKLAPSLDEAKLTFWRTDIIGGKEPELLIGFIDLIGDENVKDPYLSLWLLKYDGTKYNAIHAGPFLYGQLHYIGQFGQDSSRKMVFIKHMSCTECHPWVYLTIVDFLKGSNGDAFSFTYLENHKDFSYRIEYILPGMGHSVDAKVETRVIQSGMKGPHLIQHFILEEGGSEWWTFNCKELKCDYEFFKNSLPQKYNILWRNGQKI
jgi:hypothetical protein